MHVCPCRSTCIHNNREIMQCTIIIVQPSKTWNRNYRHIIVTTPIRWHHTDYIVYSLTCAHSSITSVTGVTRTSKAAGGVSTRGIGWGTIIHILGTFVNIWDEMGGAECDERVGQMRSLVIVISLILVHLVRTACTQCYSYVMYMDNECRVAKFETVYSHIDFHTMILKEMQRKVNFNLNLNTVFERASSIP